jgi:hypothetical protein
MAIEKLKRHRSPSIDKIPADYKTLTNQTATQEETKSRLKSRIVCHLSVKNLLSSSLPP